jgi:hypothetical protein
MFFLILALFAQQPPPDMPLTPERRALIIENAAKKIEELYVDPAKGKESPRHSGMPRSRN